MKTQTIFLRLVYEGPRVTTAPRIPKSLRNRLEQRAAQAGCKLSPVIAGLLEAALDLEERLAPFQPAIERLIREDNLSAVDAISKLLWMDVEFHPQEVLLKGLSRLGVLQPAKCPSILNVGAVVYECRHVNGNRIRGSPNPRASPVERLVPGATGGGG